MHGLHVATTTRSFFTVLKVTSLLQSGSGPRVGNRRLLQGIPHRITISDSADNITPDIPLIRLCTFDPTHRRGILSHSAAVETYLQAQITHVRKKVPSNH